MSAHVMQGVLLFVILGSMAALVTGVALLTTPRQTVRDFGFAAARGDWMARWTKPLAHYFHLDRPLRFSRLLELVLLSGGSFVLVRWNAYATEVNAVAIAVGGDSGFASMLSIGMSAIVMAAAIIAVVIGALGWVHPKTLYRLSRLGSRRAAVGKSRDTMFGRRYGLDKCIVACPKGWGGVIAALGCYLLAMVVWFA